MSGHDTLKNCSSNDLLHRHEPWAKYIEREIEARQSSDPAVKRLEEISVGLRIGRDELLVAQELATNKHHLPDEFSCLTPQELEESGRRKFEAAIDAMSEWRRKFPS